MIDTVYIDGLEIRKTWGLTPLYEKFYSSIMQFPDVKEKVTNDFEDEDGIEVASTDSYLKSREPVLSLGVDTYENYLNFMQYMVEEAQRMGFSADDARQLVQETALGAAQMVIANPETELATLRAQVTYKGGTTAAAINAFEEGKLAALVSAAMQAAQHRAEEMETLF